jgi:hypothetical protein
MGTTQSFNVSNDHLAFLACCYDSNENSFFKNGGDNEDKQRRVRRMSSIGALDLCDTEFEHPFLEAVATKNLEEMKRTVLTNPSIVRTVRDTRGNTAAHIAACYGHRKELEFLVQQEYDILWAQNEVKNTPIHKAAEAGKVDILEYARDTDPSLLASKGAMGASPMHLAASRGSLQAVIFLASNNETLLTMRDRRGFTVVHYGAMHGHVEVVKWIAEARPSLLKERNNQGDSPAHLAAMNGKVAVLRFLAEKDPDTVLHGEDSHGRYMLSRLGLSQDGG